MSVGRQIIDGYGLCAKSRPPLRRLHCDQAAMAERNSAHTVSVSDVVCIKPEASETYSYAGHCKQTVQGPSNTLHTCPGFRAVSHIAHSQTTAYTGRLVHWATHCLSYYTSLWGSQSPQMKEGRKEL